MIRSTRLLSLRTIQPALSPRATILGRNITPLFACLSSASIPTATSQSPKERSILFKTVKWGTILSLGTLAGGAAWIRFKYGENTLSRLLRSYMDAIPAFGAYKKVALREKFMRLLGKEVAPEEIHKVPTVKVDAAPARSSG